MLSFKRFFPAIRSSLLSGFKGRSLATAVAPTRIPVIDFSKFRTARSAEEKKTTADEIVGAFKDSGFIYVSNHGIPERTYAVNHSLFES
jgi:hypothetical protein